MRKGCILELGCSWKENRTQLGHSSFCPCLGRTFLRVGKICCRMEWRGRYTGESQDYEAKSVVSEDLWGPATERYPSVPQGTWSPLRRLRDSRDSPPDALCGAPGLPCLGPRRVTRGRRRQSPRFCEASRSRCPSCFSLSSGPARCQSGGSHTQGPPYCRRLRQKRKLI